MPKTVKWNANLSMIVEDARRPTLPRSPDSRVAPYREGRKRAAAAHESAAVTSVESMRTRRGPAWQARPGIQHARPNREATPRPMTS
jgi:hypothetical protein